MGIRKSERQRNKKKAKQIEEETAMAFIDDMKGKFSQASSSTVQKAKELSEIVKLNNEISGLEEQIGELYVKIGYEVYCAYCENPLPEVEGLIGQVVELQDRMNGCKQRIKEINAVNTCPNCSAKISRGMAFCSKCGYRLPEQEQPPKETQTLFCTNCGASIFEGVMFCSSCGTRVG